MKSKDRSIRRIAEASSTLSHDGAHFVFLQQVLFDTGRTSPRGINKCIHLKKRKIQLNDIGTQVEDPGEPSPPTAEENRKNPLLADC